MQNVSLSNKCVNIVGDNNPTIPGGSSPERKNANKSAGTSSRHTSVLRRWAASYIAVLLIPLLMAACNHIYAYSTMRDSVELVNRAIVENLKNNFEQTLHELSSTYEVIFQAADFKALLSAHTHEQLSRASVDAITLFRNHCRTDARMSILSYFPQHDHVVHDISAYTPEGVYRVLSYDNPNLAISRDEYISQLSSAENTYAINQYRGYSNYGRECLTLSRHISDSALPTSNGAQGGAFLHLSIALDNELGLIGSMQNQTMFLILDRTAQPLHMWDSNGASLDSAGLELAKLADGQARYNGDEYIALTSAAERSGFTYVMLTPESVLFSKLTELNNFDMLTLAFTMAACALLTYLFLKRNYRPLKRILDALGMGQLTGNEYERIMLAYHSLVKENNSIRQTMDMQNAYVQEKFLLSRLLGRGNRLHDVPAANEVEHAFEGHTMRVMAICPADRASEEARLDRIQLVINEALLRHNQGQFEFSRVIDGDWILYVFKLAPDQDARWIEWVRTVAAAISSEYERTADESLIVVLSNACERLEYLSETYFGVSNVLECMLNAGESGVVWARDLLSDDASLTTDRRIAERKLSEAIKAGNSAAAEDALASLFNCVNQRQGGTAHAGNGAAVVPLPFQFTRFMYFDILQRCFNAFAAAQAGDLSKIEQLRQRMGEIGMSVDRAEMEDGISRFVAEGCALVRRTRATRAQSIAVDICEYVEAHYAEHNLNVGAIANAMHVSSQTATQYFKAEMNMSVLEYIGRVRILHARELAAGQKMSIEEIADAVGYSSARTFHRVYLKLEGVTPGKGLKDF